jgi:hypothetical protein
MPTITTTLNAPPLTNVTSSYGTFSSKTSYQPPPFSISFSWNGKSKTITLENGEDVLKVADIAATLLKINNIPFKITES